MNKIMIVDDEENILAAVKRMLRRYRDWDVEEYSSPELALKRAQCCIFDVVISDYKMPTMNGVDFLSELKAIQPNTVRILLTGSVQVSTLLESINKAGVFRFIAKPWDDDEFVEIVKAAIDHRETAIENQILADKVRDQYSQNRHLQ
ncbi:Hydrogenase transcriptional regulatory protein hupR1 [BD1-7 clade bacterium]|uniref:Hydrogenase transcriptional regulatory protein hupR1 n=1 Tax=BD1-7 clade bacterium TaxID=2029982 RepID=A0A5S9QSG8_9GAMM|nr:Hydrogenase transcriptional regulatory protein hupR1 [BD1-7 clade bacterium]CAA0121787.1 Hydrogenase transcriptional regulatory protein hupR1 [BD1-7 clade bacterium]CAA0124577.1 Hydrogenase transcriptional regulatory protein hupR1 [BD1-7 clade bacterium]